jgi:hypothetical protein
MTKGAATAEEIDGLQAAGFTAAVSTIDNISLRVTEKLNSFQVAHLKYIQLGEKH